jgi:UDP-glucose 4-epimerase
MDHKKIVTVIGANGFVGSHIVDKLVASDQFEVRAFDRFSRKINFKNHPKIKLFKGDYFEDKVLDSALDGTDYVIHSFSSTTPYLADINPLDGIKMLQRDVEVFNKCVNNNVKKLAYISSGGAVYGTLSEDIAASESHPAQPISPYGIMKLATENYLNYFKRKNELDFVIYRLTNPYGPRQKCKKSQGVIAAFIDNILKSDNITVYGDGSNSRDFIYVEDAAEMIVNNFSKSNKHSVYNLGSGEQTSLNQIIENLRILVNSKINLRYEEAPKTFLKRTPISMERYRDEFGAPKLHSFEEGLRKTFLSRQEELLSDA